LRQPILYAEELWKRQRFWALFMIGFGTLMVILVFATRLLRSSEFWPWLLWVPCGVAYAGILTYYRRRSYIETTEAGLKVSNLLSSVLIDYDTIRLVRVQPLGRHFENSRKKLIRPISRPLMPRPALFVRLRGDEAEVSKIRRKLGSQLAAEDTLAVPVPDPEAMSSEISSRLPDRRNLGGQRRRKRSR
jgi:hypothetical protein